MANHDDHDFAVSIVTFHEQALGAHRLAQSARNDATILQAYRLMQRAFVDYQRFPVLEFDEKVLAQFHTFPGNLRVNKMDLRIAAVAVANDLILLTRNARDFSRIPGLKFEDWTIDPL